MELNWMALLQNNFCMNCNTGLYIDEKNLQTGENNSWMKL